VTGFQSGIKLRIALRQSRVACGSEVGVVETRLGEEAKPLEDRAAIDTTCVVIRSVRVSQVRLTR
jgi:hypothetical protein